MANNGIYYSLATPIYQPAQRDILTITQGNPTTITTTYDGTDAQAHDYLSGLIVRLVVPLGYGIQQLNGYLGPINVINTTQFTVNIDSTQFDPFVVPSYQPGFNGTPPQVIPVGEVGQNVAQAVRNVLPYPGGM